MAETDKDKRVSLEGLAAVYDDVKKNKLGNMSFAVDPEDGGMNITCEYDEIEEEVADE